MAESATVGHDSCQVCHKKDEYWTWWFGKYRRVCSSCLADWAPPPPLPPS
jgi:hypothetical protein